MPISAALLGAAGALPFVLLSAPAAPYLPGLVAGDPTAAAIVGAAVPIAPEIQAQYGEPLPPLAC